MRGKIDLLIPWRARSCVSRLELGIRSLPALLYMGGIFLMSSVPGKNLPQVADDRLEHFVEYFVLGGLLLIPVAGFAAKRLAMLHLMTAWGLAAIYGATDEFHQRFVPGRDSSPKDLAFDALGAAVALALLLILVRRTEIER